MQYFGIPGYVIVWHCMYCRQDDGVCVGGGVERILIVVVSVSKLNPNLVRVPAVRVSSTSICNRHFVPQPSPVTICTRCKFWVISHQINLYWTLFKAEKNKKIAVLCRPWQKLRIRAGYRVLSGGQIYVFGVEQGHLGGARIISCLKWALLGGCQIYTQTS